MTSLRECLKKRFDELKEAYNRGGKHIQKINQGLLMFSGKYKVGVDTFSTITDAAQDFRSKGFEGAREVVVNGDQEIDTSNLTASEIKVLQNLIDNAKQSGQKVSIILHDDESYTYINNGEPIRSPIGGVLIDEGMYVERSNGSREIHLHEDADLSRVAYHEYGHYFLESLFEANPEMLYDIAEEIRGLKSERVQELVKGCRQQYGRIVEV